MTNEIIRRRLKPIKCYYTCVGTESRVIRVEQDRIVMQRNKLAGELELEITFDEIRNNRTHHGTTFIIGAIRQVLGLE